MSRAGFSKHGIIDGMYTLYLLNRFKRPELVIPAMECVFTDPRTQCGFPVDVQYEV